MGADLPDDFAGDLLGDIAASEPGLDVLLGHLTGDPTPGELADEPAALAMFRGNGPRAGSRAPGASRWGPRRVRLLAAVAAVAAAAGLVAAAYTATLPGPLQNVAYHVLGFAGVPQQSGHAAPPARGGAGPAGPAPVRGRSHAPSGRSRPAASASPPPASASPAPGSPTGTLTVTAASGRIAAGAGDTFTGLLTARGSAVPGTRLTLLERPAGQQAWTVAGQATTGPDGRAGIGVADLTRNATFRLSAADGAQSRPVLVVVVPAVSASVSGGPAGPATALTATSPLAEPGDTVVLQILSSGRWVSVRSSRLDGSAQAGFVLHTGGREHAYRVVLMPTAAHALSVSNTVTSG